jgi:FkbM family methyltransferase
MMLSWLSELIKYIKTGRTPRSKAKILIVCLLKLTMDLSPRQLGKYIDLLAKGMLFETDVKFRIGTVFDFFVFSKIWEHQLVSILNFRKGMIFIDVGAHIGRYTVRAGLKAGRKGTIIAVEPNIDNYRLLRENISLNGLHNCLPLNIAAYRRDAKLALYTGNDSAKNSIKTDLGKGSQKVQARALDNVLRENSVEKVDLIKIDVEGAEYDVLKGLEETLEQDSPVLMVELLKKDEKKVLQLMKGLQYQESIVDSSDYEGGLIYYSFKKSK